MKYQRSCFLSLLCLDAAISFSVKSNLKTSPNENFSYSPSTPSAFLSKSISNTLLQNENKVTFKKSTILKSSINDLLTSPKTGYDHECDVLILGSGPAAKSLAALLSKNSNLKISLSDTEHESSWIPNYGSWAVEWATLAVQYGENKIPRLESVIDTKWDITDCYFGGSFDMPMDQRLRLNEGYIRVDKDALQELFTKDTTYTILKTRHFSKAIGMNIFAPDNSLVHDETGSTIVLADEKNEKYVVRTKLIVDCTGHETKLIQRDTSLPYEMPGFQIAYGALVEVDDASVVTNAQGETKIGPYDVDSMTLFDYRTDHIPEENTKYANDAPTFMYAMPLHNSKDRKNKIFFEETSLVARPAMSFETCKERCYQRLEHLGINVVNIEEEEFCYIPMGGPLPARHQRIVGLGGGNTMVHPSTGYNLCRTLKGALDMSKTIIDQFEQQQLPEVIAAKAYNTIWSQQNIKQRNFAVFGGEFLQKQKVVGLRGFFSGFFNLPTPLWLGFLTGWPGLPFNSNHESWGKRLYFGLNFVSKLPPTVALDMLLSIINYSFAPNGEINTALLQSVTPFFGNPISYESVTSGPKLFDIGDVTAKNEAQEMISKGIIQRPIKVIEEKSVVEKVVSEVTQEVDEEAVSEVAQQVEEEALSEVTQQVEGKVVSEVTQEVKETPVVAEEVPESPTIMEKVEEIVEIKTEEVPIEEETPADKDEIPVKKISPFVKDIQSKTIMADSETETTKSTKVSSETVSPVETTPPNIQTADINRQFQLINAQNTDVQPFSPIEAAVQKISAPPPPSSNSEKDVKS